VTAYICGHTHNASIAKINGLWQFDAGHARGIEAVFPTMVVEDITEKIAEGRKTGKVEESSVAEYFRENAYEVKKVLYYSGLTQGVSYKEIDDNTALPILSEFYNNYSENDQFRDKYISTFWDQANLARSTFMKVIISNDEVKIEIYRDDARGGVYSLMHTTILN
jgi:hypothetical protein